MVRVTTRAHCVPVIRGIPGTAGAPRESRGGAGSVHSTWKSVTTDTTEPSSARPIQVG